MDTLSCHGYIEYTLDPKTKKLTYKICDFVVKCSGSACLPQDDADEAGSSAGYGAVYATEGYGFLCLPRDITKQLAEDGYTFDDADAWLDLWCHTVWQDPRNIFSFQAPTVQYGQNGAVLTLEALGGRWGWEKTKVWRFLQKHQDAFTLHKLPGSYGCLIFNKHYPAGALFAVPAHVEVARIFSGIANILGISADVVTCRDAYALTIWSIDDIDDINDDRITAMSEADKKSFMEFAELQLKSDMTERGFDSLETLLDLYFSAKTSMSCFSLSSRPN
jgi:hypothetical protein